MRFKLIAQVLLASLAAVVIAHGQSNNNTTNVSAARGADGETEAHVYSVPGADSNRIHFILAAIDNRTRDEFQKAWSIAKSGGTPVEAVVLLYRGRNGLLIARSQGCTNERLSFSFEWSPTIIAIVHTHPNSASPEPQRNDLQIADRFQVPIFTITNRGMFVYDPANKKTTKVIETLAWLKPSKQSRDTLAQK